LPRNTEIEAALLLYQRLFGGEQHVSTLREQRRVALEAMRILERFEPRLVGSVLSGSATEYADIQLHVFFDSAEAVILHLMDRRLEHEVFERKVRMTPDRVVGVPSVRFEMSTETVEAFVFPKDGIRQAPISPVDGRPMRRASLQEVSDLEQ
jgi:predicted nucleotidyltransferase